jgi:hypothetical protein
VEVLKSDADGKAVVAKMKKLETNDPVASVALSHRCRTMRHMRQSEERAGATWTSGIA